MAQRVISQDSRAQAHLEQLLIARKAPGEGTGLGLAVVHGVIKNHEGAIVISSALGVGTTFSVYLPVFDGRGLTISSNMVTVSPMRRQASPRLNDVRLVPAKRRQNTCCLGEASIRGW